MADLDLLHTAPSDPHSSILFSAIVATVAATTDRRLTVREIALRLDVNAAVAAQCIAFHRDARAHADGTAATGALSASTPVDFSSPGPDDVIDELALGLSSDLDEARRREVESVGWSNLSS